MQFGQLIACACVLWLLSAQAASSVTLKNLDKAAYDIDVLENSQRQRKTIKSGERLRDVCKNACLVTLVGIDDGVYTLDGGEKIVIEDGLIYYEDVLGTSEPGTAAQNAR